MKKLIFSAVLGLAALSFPAVSLADGKTVLFEPNQSPPINAKDHFVRMEGYSTQTVYVKNGILVSLKIGQTPEDTYLPDSSGIDKSLMIEMDCQTGKGFLTGVVQGSAPMPMKPQPIDLLKDPYEPHIMAITLACKYYLGK